MRNKALDIIDRIKQVIENNHLSIEEFAQRINEKPARLRDVLRKKQRPPVELLTSIVEIFHIDAAWLLMGDATIQSDNNQKQNIDIEDYAFIPAHDIWASAGHGAESFDDVPRRRLAFRKRWLALHGYNEKDLCAIFAKGDSMEPTISEWTTLIINRAYKRPIDGKIFIIRQGDNLFVKRLQIQLNGSILLLSDNPAYPPMLLSASDLEQVDIIGQVVHISKDV